MEEASIDIPQDFAHKLFTAGATLILLDVPRGTDIGIDLKSWTTEEKFKGIKMIPPGFHYVHYSAVNEFGEMAPRSGFLHMFKSMEVVVKKWDKVEEDINPDLVPEEMVQRLQDNLQNLDRNLGPYPYEIWIHWKDLTTHITPAIIERCAPLCGYVKSALELEHCKDADRLRANTSSIKKKRSRLTIEEKEEALLPDLKPKPGTELRFTKLPDKQYPDNASPTEITSYSLDTSFALNNLLSNFSNSIEIIGEMQLAFVCFLVGQSFEAFEHWKKLITLICGADQAISQHHSVFFDFLKTIGVHLMHVPEDMLCDIVAGNNFIYQNLRKLFANIEINEEVDDRLKTYVVRLSDRLSKKFLWDFTQLQEEAEDEAPVVVSLE